MPRESRLEARCRLRARDRGFLFRKTYGPTGFPDRSLDHPRVPVCFVELKQRGAKPSSAQDIHHGQLRRMGFRVEVIDTFEAFERLLDDLLSTAEVAVDVGDDGITP